VGTILGGGAGRGAFLEACTPGYYNNEGRMDDRTAASFPYGAGPVSFIALLKQWREAGDFAGLELDGAPVRAADGAPKNRRIADHDC
jgi:cyclohexanone monooxygenase